MTLLLAWLLAGTQDSSAVQRALYQAQLAAAEGAARHGEYAVAREWLDRTDPQLRGFEWRLWDATLEQSLTSWTFTDAHGTALAISPDEHRLACGLSDGSLELRSSADGSVIWRIAQAHAAALTDLRFDASGKRLISASYDRTVKIWEASDGKQLLEFKGHSFPVGAALFLDNGDTAISASYERPNGTVVGTVKHWRTSDGAVLRTLSAGRKPLVDLAISTDGTQLAAASWDFCVFVWNLASDAPAKQLDMPQEGIYNAVDGVAFSPNGSLIAAGSRDHTVRVWNAASGALLHTLRGHVDGVAKLAFAPDGSELVSVGADGTVRFWGDSDGLLRGLALGHREGVVDLAIAAQRQRVFTVARDGTLRSWGITSSRYDHHAMKADAVQYAAQFAPDGSRIASCGYNGRVQLFDAASEQLIDSWQAHHAESSCHALAWSATGDWIATGSYDKSVRLWSLPDHRELARLEHQVPLAFLRVSNDGTLLASVGAEFVHLWSVPERSLRFRFARHQQTVRSVAFSGDGSLAVSVDKSGRLLVWRTTDGEVVSELTLERTDLADALFAPAQSEIVVASSTGSITAHRWPGFSSTRNLAQLRQAPVRLAISPDGSRLAVACGAIAIIDLQHGGLLTTFRPEKSSAYAVSFDPSGLRLIAAAQAEALWLGHAEPLRTRVERLASQRSPANRTNASPDKR